MMGISEKESEALKMFRKFILTLSSPSEKESETLLTFKAFHTEYYDYVVELIGKEKADIWFYTENPHLGNVSPVFLIMKGKSKKLISFIKSAMKK